MKNILYLSLAAVTLALGSCSNEDDFGGQSAVQGNDVISAVAPSKDTRTSMNGKSVFWDNGDAIGVISRKDGASDNNTQYTLSQGGGTASGQFSGMSEEDYKKVAAYYPYNASVKFDSDELSLTLPEDYTYDANHPESNNKAPMACLIESGAQNDIIFKHAGALMHIELKNIPQNCTTIKLTSANADCKLTGAAKITFASGTPTLAIADDTQAAADTGDDTPAEGHTITIHFTNTTARSTKSFYFPIPVYNYTALTLSVEGTGDFKPQTIKSKSLNAERGTRYNSTLTFDEMSGVLPTEVESVEKIKETLAQTNAVLVADVADVSTGESGTTAAPEIALPKVAEGDVTAKSVSIAFNKISTENPITIKEDETSGGTGETKAVAEKVTIAVPPVVEGGSKAPKVDIQLENSTVTLAVTNGEKTTFEEVTAATADNTLVVENGVTIKKLIIKKGNIRLKGKAAITELVKDKDYQGTTPIKIIVEGDGYTLPSGGVPEGFELVNGVAADLNKVATEGGEYTLPANVTGNFVISAEKPVVINLNGYTITNKSDDTFTVNFGSTLTINGNGTVDNVTNGKTCIYNNGTVVLNGGEYTRTQEAGTQEGGANGNSYYNILNHGVMTINPGVNVHANGSHSSLIASGYYSYKAKPEQQASARSNYVSGTNHEYPSLTIKGGTFEGGLNTVKNDDGATLTIENGTFTNTAQAPVQNNHIATISGGTFTPQEAATHVVESRYSNPIYDWGKTTISGGTFNGVLYLDGASPSLTISGGTFSDPHALDYLTAGANVNVRLLADTELTKTVEMKQGTATFDLNGKRLTTTTAALRPETSDPKMTCAIQADAGAKLTVENGFIGNNTVSLWYGIFSKGAADVIIKNIDFGEMIHFAYNGGTNGGNGTLTATGCTFRGWLSAWFGGGKFTDCTFTIGKKYYPAAICYGNTVFTRCKFFKNGVDSDVYDNTEHADDGSSYFSCDYTIAACNPTTTIDFKECKFINESGTVTDNVTKSNHPYHACDQWGDGETANANVKVDGEVVTSKCSVAASAQK